MKTHSWSNAAGGVLVTLGAVVALIAGCARQENTYPPVVARVAPGCALGVSGSKVVADATPEGMSLSFTSEDQPYAMRERAHSAAAQHGPGAHKGRGHEGVNGEPGQHGQGADHGLQMVQGPAARTAAVDIEGGARIDFVPAEAGELEALRTRLRERALAMNAEKCTPAGLRAQAPVTAPER